jgi:hypothetical protein
MTGQLSIFGAATTRQHQTFGSNYGENNSLYTNLMRRQHRPSLESSLAMYGRSAKISTWTGSTMANVHPYATTHARSMLRACEGAGRV